MRISFIAIIVAVAVIQTTDTARARELMLDMHTRTYRLYVYADGGLELYNDRKGLSDDPIRKTVSKEGLQKLEQAFDKADFFNLEDLYNVAHGTLPNGVKITVKSSDRPAHILRYRKDGRDKTIRYTAAPHALQELYANIQDAVDINIYEELRNTRDQNR